MYLNKAAHVERRTHINEDNVKIGASFRMTQSNAIFSNLHAMKNKLIEEKYVTCF